METITPYPTPDPAPSAPSSVVCAPANVHFLRTVLAPMFTQAHWEEVGQDKTWKPQLFWKHYEELEAVGQLFIVVLWVNGAPEGYFVGVLGQPLHYEQKRIAHSDMFYISPAYRATFAVRLFRAAKDCAKIAGASKLYVNHKVYKDITPILKRLHFKPIEIVSVVSLED